jgi:hypothetical protein
MTRSLTLLVLLAIGLIASVPWTASAQQNPYDELVDSIRTIEGLKNLTRADKDKHIRNIMKIRQNNAKIERHVTDPSTRWAGPGDRPTVTGPKRTDALMECYQKCLDSGNDGGVCYKQCIK